MSIWVWAWIHLLFLIEAAMVGAAFGIRARFRAVEDLGDRVARHRLAPLAAGLLAVVLRVAVLPIEPVPAPGVHDEFSYLLAADTFLHGRLANPTHPLWKHFETMQEEFVPTYASMYPPAQGLALAAGTSISGVAFTGVVLSVGAMCAALCWALGAWLPRGWAFFGAVLAAVRLGMFSYWGDSYWGGALAATGGALVFGAVGRLPRGGPRYRGPRYGVLAGLGAALLINTRPFEGAVFLAAAGCVAVTGRKAERNLGSAGWTACATMLAVIALMGVYNWRVFGSPTTMPYSVNRKTYAVAQIFLWQAPRTPPPAYRHEALRDFYVGYELQHFLDARTPGGYVKRMAEKAGTFWTFFVGPILTVPLAAAAWTLRSRRTRVFLWLCGAVALASALTPWFMPHYVAPITAPFWALLLQGMRALRQWRPAAVRGIAVVCAAMVAVRIAMAVSPIPFVLTYPMTWGTTWTMKLERERIASQLHAMGGRHVVIVHYDAGHDPLREYVFNGADIDGSEVIWARDMGAQNRELTEYYGSRKIWLLLADRQPPELRAYTGAAQ